VVGNVTKSKFLAVSSSVRKLKIGQHLPKLCLEWHGFLTRSVVEHSIDWIELE